MAANQCRTTLDNSYLYRFGRFETIFATLPHYFQSVIDFNDSPTEIVQLL